MTDTAAAAHPMISQSFYTLSGGLSDTRCTIEPSLYRRMTDVSELTVEFCVVAARQHNDATPAAEVVAMGARDFLACHWLWDRPSELDKDPRSLQTGDAGASLHPSA